MSLFKNFHLVAMNDAQHAAFKALGHDVASFAVNDLDKAVAAAKQTEIGAAAVSAVHAVEDPTLSGPEKMAKAVSIVAPVVLGYAAKGGFGGVIADVESFARQLLESTLADVKATAPVKVAEALLKVVGG